MSAGIPDKVSTHVETAQDNLTSMFRGRKNIMGMVLAFVKRSQKLEDVQQTLLAAFANWQDDTLTLSFLLDLIGKVVGESRNGRTDAQYIPALQIRIQINRSDGTNPSILNILDLLGGRFEAFDWYPACYEVTVMDAGHFEAIAADMEDAKPLGVQACIALHPNLDGALRLGSVTDTVGARGYGSVTDVTAGGSMSHVRVR